MTTTRTPVTELLSMAPLPNFDMVGFFGERAAQCRAKLIYSVIYPADVKALNALQNATAAEVLELALFAHYTTPFGSSSAALRQAIDERARAPRDDISLLRQKVLDDELWFGWMTETGTVFAASACDAVARTFYDSSLAYGPPGPTATDIALIYGDDAHFMYRTRATFHETHYAACKFKLSADRERLDAHRAPLGARRSGRKLAPPTGFAVISHPAKKFTGDVVCPNKDGVYDPDARPCFVAVDELSPGGFSAQLAVAMRTLGLRSAIAKRSTPTSPRKRSSPPQSGATTAPKRGRRVVDRANTALDEVITVLGEEVDEPQAIDLLAPVQTVDLQQALELRAPAQAPELQAPTQAVELQAFAQARELQAPAQALEVQALAQAPESQPPAQAFELPARGLDLPLFAEAPQSPTDKLFDEFWTFDAAKELHAAVWGDESDLLNDSELGEKFDALVNKVIGEQKLQAEAFHVASNSTVDWSMPFDTFSQQPTLFDLHD